MNDESMKNLERDLARFRPAELSQPLKERLQREPVDEPLTIGDRVLVAFSGLGSLAACVIVTVGIVQWSAATPAPPSQQDIAAQQQMAVEYQRLLASR